MSAILKALQNRKVEVELQSEIVEFAITDELKTLVNALNSQLSIDDRVLSETRQISNQISSLIKKAKDRAKTNDSVASASEKKTDLAIDAMNKAEKAAKELGVDVSKISNYKEVKKLADSVLTNIFELERLNDALKKLI